MGIRQMKSEKAARLDNKLAEIVEPDIEAIANMLHVLFRRIREEEQEPLADCKGGYLMKIPKGGDMSKCGNYRNIAPLSIPGDVFNSVG